MFFTSIVVNCLFPQCARVKKKNPEIRNIKYNEKVAGIIRQQTLSIDVPMNQTGWGSKSECLEVIGRSERV